MYIFVVHQVSEWILFSTYDQQNFDAGMPLETVKDLSNTIKS